MPGWPTTPLTSPHLLRRGRHAAPAALNAQRRACARGTESSVNEVESAVRRTVPTVQSRPQASAPTMLAAKSAAPSVQQCCNTGGSNRPTQNGACSPSMPNSESRPENPRRPARPSPTSASLHHCSTQNPTTTSSPHPVFNTNRPYPPTKDDQPCTWNWISIKTT